MTASRDALAGVFQIDAPLPHTLSNGRVAVARVVETLIAPRVQCASLRLRVMKIWYIVDS